MRLNMYENQLLSAMLKKTLKKNIITEPVEVEVILPVVALATKVRITAHILQDFLNGTGSKRMKNSSELFESNFVNKDLYQKYYQKLQEIKNEITPAKINEYSKKIKVVLLYLIMFNRE